jgi:hypothetical protein
MDHLVPLQHADEMLDFLRARLGSFHRLDPEQDGVSVRAVQGREKRLGFRACVERTLKVVRHAGGSMRVVRGVPLTVRLRAVHSLEAG